MMDAPLVRHENGMRYFVVGVHDTSIKCRLCSKVNDTDCTTFVGALPKEQRCGPQPVIYIRATPAGVAEYIARKMK